MIAWEGNINIICVAWKTKSGRVRLENKYGVERSFDREVLILTSSTPIAE